MSTEYGMTQIFGWYDGDIADGRLITCRLCGSTVQYSERPMELHRTWHNVLVSLLS